MATINDTHKPHQVTTLHLLSLPLRAEDINEDWCSEILHGAPMADVEIISPIMALHFLYSSSLHTMTMNIYTISLTLPVRRSQKRLSTLSTLSTLDSLDSLETLSTFDTFDTLDTLDTLDSLERIGAGAYPLPQQQHGGSFQDMIREYLKPGPFNAVAPRSIGVPDGHRFEEHVFLLLDRERIQGAFESPWSGSDDDNPNPYTIMNRFPVHRPRRFLHRRPLLNPGGRAGVPGTTDVASGNGSPGVAYFVASALTASDLRAHKGIIMKAILA